jgi:hypothetical protein
MRSSHVIEKYTRYKRKINYLGGHNDKFSQILAKIKFIKMWNYENLLFYGSSSSTLLVCLFAHTHLHVPKLKCEYV